MMLAGGGGIRQPICDVFAGAQRLPCLHWQELQNSTTAN